MKMIRDLFLNRTNKMIICMIALFMMLLFTNMTVGALDKEKAEERRDQSAITTGSGERYTTTVKRYTEGNLSSEDLHQVSLLTSHIVNHLNGAADGLRDQNPDETESEIKNAQKLIKVVRDLLPVTTVATVVKDNEGKEVYQNVDKVQDDRIALYEGMIAMEVVEPIIDAKEKAAELKGLRLADANVIHTSVLANLSYIERKLNRALALMKKPDEALVQLELAQTQGIELVINKEDNPLVEVQHALRLAERMVEEGKYEAAQDNLRLSQVQLGVYRGLMGKDAGKDVKQLEDEIAALMPKIKEKGAADKIRNFWERAVNWFREEPGQAHVIEKESKEATSQTE